jgi:crotonobetainyl-CoA:carnitine CoA-transferase CaiB-like acyl-CoA transferase
VSNHPRFFALSAILRRVPESTVLISMLRELWTALGGEFEFLNKLEITGSGDLPSVFPVSDLATAAIGTAGLAAAELVAARFGEATSVQVDRRLSSFWFGLSVRPQGWPLLPIWDPLSADYEAKDGWIRLHMNAPHHRGAALSVLKAEAKKESIAREVAHWEASALEAAVVTVGGCAATMRSTAEWKAHPQGRVVAAEPLIYTRTLESDSKRAWDGPRERPLKGLRILDLTRVLAGPVATRFLAGLGAEVLRIDPPWWDEPVVVSEVALGKRCARLDLREPSNRDVFIQLLMEADVLIHGYRPEALTRLGFDAERRQKISPGLIDVTLDAYGWAGPWKGRRGFDSLVQMSSGIADTGMKQLNRTRPTPLPVQALDHSVGYFLAAAAMRGLTSRFEKGTGFEARTSLARMAALLIDHACDAHEPIAPEIPDDLSKNIEETAWGPARRIKPPVIIDGAPLRWDVPASALGSSEPKWQRAG